MTKFLLMQYLVFSMLKIFIPLKYNASYIGQINVHI